MRAIAIAALVGLIGASHARRMKAAEPSTHDVPRQVAQVPAALAKVLMACNPAAAFSAPAALGRAHVLKAMRSGGPILMSSTVTAEVPAKPAATGTSVSSSIINLSKNIVGSGVLALSGGIAAYSAAPSAVLPSIAILCILGALSGYTFSLIARVGDEVGAETYRDTWSKVFGEKTALLPALTVLFKTGVAALSYAIILGDSFASIGNLAGLPAILQKSNPWIILLSAGLLLPLALLRDLSSLAIGSIIGSAGTLYTALFIFIRYFDKSYAAGGAFSMAIAESSRPLFAAASAARPLINSKIFVLISMLATSFLAHYNAPKFFKELAEPTDGSSKQASFNKVCAGAFGAASLICGAIMAGGYLTFGGASQGLILNSYASSDPLALLARLGICASIIFSYPLNFVGLREGVLDLFKLDGAKKSVHVLSTVALLSVMNGLALVVKNLGLVVAVGGAALGTSLVYTFPALMFIQATRQKNKALAEKGEELSKGRMREMQANKGLVGLGISLGVLGVKMSLR